MENKIKWSHIKTPHEETYSDGRTLGVLINYDINYKKIDSFIYLYRQESETYVFFETIVEMNDYLLYGDNKVKKAYMKEEEFDKLFDYNFKGVFKDYLNFV